MKGSRCLQALRVTRGGTPSGRLGGLLEWHPAFQHSLPGKPLSRTRRGRWRGSASGTRHLSWLPESRRPPPPLLASVDAAPARSALPIAGPTRLGHLKTCLLGHCAQPRISQCVSCSFHPTFALPDCRRPADGLYLARFQNVHRKGIWET